MPDQTMRKRHPAGPLAVAALAGGLLWVPGCGASGDNCPDASADAPEEMIVVEDTYTGPGVIKVISTFIDCPHIIGVTVPDQLVVGSSAVVSSVIMMAPNGPTSTVLWSATSGTFLNPGQPSTEFTCVVPGPTTVTLSLNATAQCHDMLSSVVRCTTNDGGY